MVATVPASVPSAVRATPHRWDCTPNNIPQHHTLQIQVTPHHHTTDPTIHHNTTHCRSKSTPHHHTTDPSLHHTTTHCRSKSTPHYHTLQIQVYTTVQHTADPSLHHTTTPSPQTCGGPSSNTVYGTGYSRPGPPADLTQLSKSPTGMYLNWSLPTSTNGQLTEFQVALLPLARCRLYSPLQVSLSLSSSHHPAAGRSSPLLLRFSASAMSARVGDLLPGSQYKVGHGGGEETQDLPGLFRWVSRQYQPRERVHP